MNAYTALFWHRDEKFHFHESNDSPVDFEIDPADFDGGGYIGAGPRCIETDATHLWTLELPREYADGRGRFLSFYAGEIDGHDIRVDLLGNVYTLVWHGDFTEFTPDVMPDGDFTYFGFHPNGDPGAGRAFADDIEVHAMLGTFDTGILSRRRLFVGGTPNIIQGLPELSVAFIGMEQLPGSDFGGGSAQLDLRSTTFDWAQ